MGWQATKARPTPEWRLPPLCAAAKAAPAKLAKKGGKHQQHEIPDHHRSRRCGAVPWRLRQRRAAIALDASDTFRIERHEQVSRSAPRGGHFAGQIGIRAGLAFLLPGNSTRYFAASAFSIAPVSSGESGVAFESKRASTFPSRPIRNFPKFHFTGPGVGASGPVNAA